MDTDRYAKQLTEAAAKICTAFGYNGNSVERLSAYLETFRNDPVPLTAAELAREIPKPVYVGNRAKRRSDAAKARKAF